MCLLIDKSSTSLGSCQADLSLLGPNATLLVQIQKHFCFKANAWLAIFLFISSKFNFYVAEQS